MDFRKRTRNCAAINDCLIELNVRIKDHLMGKFMTWEEALHIKHQLENITVLDRHKTQLIIILKRQIKSIVHSFCRFEKSFVEPNTQTFNETYGQQKEILNTPLNEQEVAPINYKRRNNKMQISYDTASVKSINDFNLDLLTNVDFASGDSGFNDSQNQIKEPPPSIPVVDIDGIKIYDFTDSHNSVPVNINSQQCNMKLKQSKITDFCKSSKPLCTTQQKSNISSICYKKRYSSPPNVKFKPMKKALPNPKVLSQTCLNNVERSPDYLSSFNKNKDINNNISTDLFSPNEIEVKIVELVSETESFKHSSSVIPETEHSELNTESRTISDEKYVNVELSTCIDESESTRNDSDDTFIIDDENDDPCNNESILAEHVSGIAQNFEELAVNSSEIVPETPVVDGLTQTEDDTIIIIDDHDHSCNKLENKKNSQDKFDDVSINSIVSETQIVPDLTQNLNNRNMPITTKESRQTLNIQKNTTIPSNMLADSQMCNYQAVPESYLRNENQNRKDNEQTQNFSHLTKEHSYAQNTPESLFSNRPHITNWTNSESSNKKNCGKFGKKNVGASKNSNKQKLVSIKPLPKFETVEIIHECKAKKPKRNSNNIKYIENESNSDLRVSEIQFKNLMSWKARKIAVLSQSSELGCSLIPETVSPNVCDDGDNNNEQVNFEDDIKRPETEKLISEEQTSVSQYFKVLTTDVSKNDLTKSTCEQSETEIEHSKLSQKPEYDSENYLSEVREEISKFDRFNDDESLDNAAVPIFKKLGELTVEFNQELLQIVEEASKKMTCKDVQEIQNGMVVTKHKNAFKKHDSSSAIVGDSTTFKMTEEQSLNISRELKLLREEMAENGLNSYRIFEVNEDRTITDWKLVQTN